uniref:Uncharacterized protein n=1 Tax=Arundo donax TaxID=35708 RepID=A0A0A9AD71_ARUDO
MDWIQSSSRRMPSTTRQSSSQRKS